MSTILYRPVTCTMKEFRQTLSREFPLLIRELQEGDLAVIYVPELISPLVYEQGSEQKFRSDIKDPTCFPDARNDFRATIALFARDFNSDIPVTKSAMILSDDLPVIEKMGRAVKLHRLRTQKESLVG